MPADINTGPNGGSLLRSMLIILLGSAISTIIMLQAWELHTLIGLSELANSNHRSVEDLWKWIGTIEEADRTWKKQESEVDIRVRELIDRNDAQAKALIDRQNESCNAAIKHIEDRINSMATFKTINPP